MRRDFRLHLVGIVRARDGDACWLCEEPIDFDAVGADSVTLDHVIPEGYGGLTSPSNIRLAHYRCNAARADVLPEACRGCGQVAPPLRWKDPEPRCYGCSVKTPAEVYRHKRLARVRAPVVRRQSR